MLIERLIATLVRGIVASLICLFVLMFLTGLSGVWETYPDPDPNATWIGLVVWAVSLSTGIWQGSKTWREPWRRCTNCLCDLAGLECTLCPECGQSCAHDHSRTRASITIHGCSDSVTRNDAKKRRHLV